MNVEIIRLEREPMRIDVHLFFHDRELHDKVDQILQKVNSIQQEERAMDQDIQNIIDQAKVNTDAEAAANGELVALFAKLQAAIAATGSLSAADRATLQATVASMKDSSAALAAAVVANTPAA
jgi:ABC-type transporter Mla subunit MlaD